MFKPRQLSRRPPWSWPRQASWYADTSYPSTLRADPAPSDDDKCVQASKEDERGVAEAFRGVRDAAKLKVQQFTSPDAFNTLRNFNAMLTAFMIEVVHRNIDEVEAIGGDPGRIGEARGRIANAPPSAPRR
jgi:hypothetical protein